MARPVIGVCAALERARWGLWDTQAVLLPREYADAIQRAGGLALVLPPDPVLVQDPDELLDAARRARSSPAAPTSTRPLRRRAARGDDRGRPGARPLRARADGPRPRARPTRSSGSAAGCRSSTSPRGGTLLQHLPDSHGHEDHRRTPGSFDGSDHDVRLRRRLAGRARRGREPPRHEVPPPPGRRPPRRRAWRSPAGPTLDELPEAIEDPERRYALGVQWHPEADEASRVIGSLVDEAVARRAARGRARATGGGGIAAPNAAVTASR